MSESECLTIELYLCSQILWYYDREVLYHYVYVSHGTLRNPQGVPRFSISAYKKSGI